jgi:hypothetical protein
MRLSCKSFILLAAMVCSVAARSTRASLRRRLNTHQIDLMDSPEALVASPEAALHIEFIREAAKKQKAPTPPKGSPPSTRPPTVEETKSSKAPSPMKAPSSIKGSSPSPPTKQERNKNKTPKATNDSGGGTDKTDKGDKGKKGGDRGKKGGSEVPGDDTEVGTEVGTEAGTEADTGDGTGGGTENGRGTGGEVTSGESFIRKFNRFDSLLSITIFLSASLTLCFPLSL